MFANVYLLMKMNDFKSNMRSGNKDGADQRYNFLEIRRIYKYDPDVMLKSYVGMAVNINAPKSWWYDR